MPIDIKKVTDDHIGRSVEYTPFPGAEVEQGVITSYNDTYIFVVYKQSQMGRGHATRPEDLEWTNGK